MENPTLVVLTDRNDLDDQLFGTFARCHDLLRQPPVQAARPRRPARACSASPPAASSSPPSRSSSPKRRATGTRVLSDRRNIVVIADEAHRSQYDFIDGFARHMRDALPNASFIGFTGTPIEKTDANTRAVFGDYISIYDIQRAVEDGATVPHLLREPPGQAGAERVRAAEDRPGVRGGHRGRGESSARRSSRPSGRSWRRSSAPRSASSSSPGTWWSTSRTRLAAMDGKAMVVCMSRRICVELYNARS